MKVAPNGEVRHLPEPEELIQAERDILRSIAAEGSCVVVGRSGFEVLKDFPNKVDIFITAPRESRIKRVMVKQHLNEVYEKLGASNRAEAVAIAMRRQLLKF